MQDKVKLKYYDEILSKPTNLADKLHLIQHLDLDEEMDVDNKASNIDSENSLADFTAFLQQYLL